MNIVLRLVTYKTTLMLLLWNFMNLCMNLKKYILSGEEKCELFNTSLY